MIKYFCDFCHLEMQINKPKPEIEVGITTTRKIAENNYKTEKIEHICQDCNIKLVNSLDEMTLEVVRNGTETQV